ncbi:deoxyguanosine kinase [Mycoplasmopsis canis PG 14]|uniref:Deoxyguanosine kinase n=1 Tax=Mycoplasmopsis canis TaxID=29555 RepID=A0A449AR13_9BACT|nr:deoxynucleoside kinase [Mycoplasmopsis canis]AMD81087.1 deoxyguanosine kinase [Mycoplasmopsis canis PG 14]EIE39848.1 deoxyguanosine kinase [Mycoplasmopsis canis PG 14]VEU68907.1 Deoxyguanosine kinase [Mycoplasmopsis canis]
MVIAVSGMIGSGKSTLTKELKVIYKNSILVEEFADEDPVFNKFLKWIYEKEPNIDIAFQSYIIESLSDTFKKEEKKFLKLYSSHKNGYMFLDRFNIEHYIFAIVTLEKKDKKYLKAFDALFQHIVDPSDNPDLAIYLDANFDVIKERILARGRAVEVDNFAENEPYFQRLHELYKELFVKLCLFYNIPYKIINTNNKKDYEVQEEAEEIINNFEFSSSKRI